MIKKILGISIVACTMMQATQVVNLNAGWNLVGFSENAPNMSVQDLINNRGISLIVTNVNGTWKKYDPNRSYLQQISNFETGRGYWIKASRDTNITIDGMQSDVIPSLGGGWNLVSFPQTKRVNELLSYFNSVGYKVDLLVANQAGTWKKYDPNRSHLQQFSSTDPNLGYWVKAELLAGSATTQDGYNVDLYTDSNNADFSAIIDAIPNYNLTELSNVNFANVSNIVVSGTHDGSLIKSGYIDPNDSSFSTALNDAKNSITNPTQATTGTSLYVYGVSEGGAPYIVSEANVYKANDDGTKGEFLGTTSQTGYLYISSVTDGEKVIVEKDGYDTTLQTLNTVSGGANYIFITQDDGSGIYQGSDDTTSNARLLNKVLHLTNAEIYTARRGVGAIITPAGSRLVHGARLKVKKKPFISFPDFIGINNILNESGYNIVPLGKLVVKARTRGHYMYNYRTPISDLLDFSSGTSPSALETIITVKLPDDLKQQLLNESGQYDVTKINDFKDNIVVYQFKNGDWSTIDNSNIQFKVKDSNSSSAYFSQTEKAFLQRNSNVEAFVSINGDAYTVASPVFAIYKKPVNVTPNVVYHSYGMNVKVTDENSQPLPNALVKMQRGNGGSETIAYTDSNGIAHFDVLEAEGALDTIHLNAMEGSHYPVSKVLNLSSLVADGNATVTMQMQTPPEYATVKGTVSDEGEGVVGAKVNLLYPIALSDVQDNAEQIINNKIVKGISVGLVPNAKYSWYIKAHSDNLGSTTGNGRVLNRVSQDRWILVQSGTASDKANFLPYNKIIAQALALPATTDPADVKIIPTGQFDIAVQVQHDVDGDGNYDFTELAKDDSATQPNLSGQSFVSHPNNSYGRTLGFVSATIDMNSIINASDIRYDPYTMYVNIDGSGWNEVGDVDDNAALQTYMDDSIAVDNSNSNDVDSDHTVGDNIQISHSNSHYIFVQNFTNTNGQDYNYTKWDMALSATLAGNAQNYYVALVKDNGGNYVWKQMDSSTLGNISATDDDKFIMLQQDTFNGLSYDKLGNAISQNKILAKLAMPLSAIAQEANASIVGDLVNPNHTLFGDGFTVSLIPTLVVTTNGLATDANVTGKVIKFRKVVSIGLGGDTPIKNYIKIDRVSVDRPALVSSHQSVHTDRVGLYQFSAVPLSYGQLNLTESLLRVQSKKLGYYNSALVNVGKFTQDDVTTSTREDVQNVDLTMSTKPLYHINVSVTDENNDSLQNAVVVMDGIKTDNTDLNEFESMQALQGSDVTFDNVIGGRGTNRVIRVSVPNSTYIPVIKTIRNLNADKNITIRLQNAADLADNVASISIIDSSVNMSSGIATIKLNARDKTDGSLTVKTSNVYVYQNGISVNANVQIDGNNVNISLPAEVGDNNIVIEMANTKGIAQTNPIHISYNPNIGNIGGTIGGIVSSDDMLVLDIYNKDGLYINTAYPQSDGQYILENLEAGKKYKLQALEINSNGAIVAKSELTQAITVPAGRTFAQDITMSEVPHSAVSGSPVFDFIGDITESNIDADGKLPISATLRNFDKTNGRFGIVVNDQLVGVDNSILSDYGEGNNSYDFTNYKVQLNPGTNIIYGVAQNPDGSFDWTADIQVDWNPTDTHTALNTLNVHLNICQSDANCTAMSDGSAYLELFDDNGNFVTSTEADGNTTSLTNLANGNYVLNVYPEMDAYQPIIGQSIDINGTTTIDANMTAVAQTIDVPDFYISEVDYNASAFQINTQYQATVQISSEDMNASHYSYNWSYTFTDSDGNVTDSNLTCTTSNCNIEFTQPGDAQIHVKVTNNNNVTDTFDSYITIQEAVVDMPPQIPVITGQ